MMLLASSDMRKGSFAAGPPLKKAGKWLLLHAALVLISVTLVPKDLGAVEPLYANLQKRLISDGLDSHLVREIYQNPQISLELEAVAGNLRRREGALDYDQFLSAYSVARAKRYLERHRRILEDAEQRFRVSPRVVVAILMVETALGRCPGKHMTINVLSTMAAADEGRIRQRILAELNATEATMQSPQRIKERLKKRAVRSYGELKALIRYIHKNNIDPFQLVGSSEGAIGIPQFLPSNIARYGRDGNGDGRIDLFNHEDAIASVASYLQAHRWPRAKGTEGKKRVLYSYNHSTYYVNTVYALAQRLDVAKVRTSTKK